MFRSDLPPDIYLSEKYLDLENKKIFRDMWMFAGVRSTLSSKSAFLTRTIGGVPVVITTDDGVTLKAFENLCAHRQMPIQSKAFGKRALVCPYHAWSYDHHGCLRAVASAELYQMRQSEKDGIKLREFAIEVIGNFVFVNLADKPRPIGDQFSAEFLMQIADVTSYFDPQYAYTTFEVDYNWKFNLENVMDYNHIPFVHTQSFGGLIKRKEAASEENQFREDVVWDAEEARKATVALPELSYYGTAEMSLKPRWYTDLVRRYGDRDLYYSWHLYPNVNFCSVAGEWFLIQQYEPISPKRMRYHLWVTTAERLNKKRDLTALMVGLMQAEKKIIDEDVVFLNNLQRNLHTGASSALHGAYEYRLIRLGKWYRDNVLAGEV